MLAGGAELELGCQEEGRGRRRHPRPTILQTQLPAPGLPGGDRDRLAEARAVPSGVGAATGSRGQPEAVIPVPPSSLKAQNRLSESAG